MEIFVFYAIFLNKYATAKNEIPEIKLYDMVKAKNKSNAICNKYKMQEENHEYSKSMGRKSHYSNL